MTAPTITIKMPVVERFDYQSIDPTVAYNLRAQAERIKQHIAKTTAVIIDIGRDLIAAKQHLDHGQFITWVETEIGINVRSAQRYMGAAEFCDKNDTVSLLPPAIVYRLAAKSAPPEVVTKIIAKAQEGEIIPDSVVVRMISDFRYQSREAKKKGARSEIPNVKNRTDTKGRKQPIKKVRVRPRLEPAQVLERCLEQVMVTIEGVLGALEDSAEAHYRVVFFETVRRRLTELEQEWSPPQPATAEVEHGDGLDIPACLRRVPAEQRHDQEARHFQPPLEDGQ